MNSFKYTPESLDDRARRLGVDLGRLRGVFDRLSEAWSELGPEEELPSVWEAITLLGPDPAMRFFEMVDPDLLLSRWRVHEELRRFPPRMLEEVAEDVGAISRVIETHQQRLLEGGWPDEPLPADTWLVSRLVPLLPGATEDAILEPREDVGPGGFVVTNAYSCTPWHLAEVRAAMLRVKVAVLPILARAMRIQQPVGLWANVAAVIRRELDGKLADFLCLADGGSYRHVLSPDALLEDQSTVADPSGEGGLVDLLTVLGECDLELQHRTSDRTARGLRELGLGKALGPLFTYVDRPVIEGLYRVLDDLSERSSSSSTAWEAHTCRCVKLLREDLEQVVHEEKRVPRRHIERYQMDLASFNARWTPALGAPSRTEPVYRIVQEVTGPWLIGLAPGKPYNDLFGFLVLRELVSRPNVCLPLPHLDALSTPDAPIANAGGAADNAVAAGELHVTHRVEWPRYEAGDKEQVAVYKRLIAQLKGDVEAAQINGNLEAREEAEQQLKKVRRQYDLVAAPRGRARALDSTYRKLTQRVETQWERAVEAIRSADPQLADHIARALKKDRTGWTYRASGPTWLTR